MSFDVDAFVTACRHAADASDPTAAVSEVVAAAIADGPSIDAALGTSVYGARDNLFVSPDLTVQRIGWPAGSQSNPHDHRMWAVVGVYEGTEVNRLFQRTSHGLVEQSVCSIEQGQVLVLDETAVHAVGNPCRGRTVGLHVYGGDIVGIGRSEWDRDGREMPFGENAAPQLAMFRTVAVVAAEYDRTVTHDDVYVAYDALYSACIPLGRYLSAEEARPVVVKAWGLVAH